MIIKVLDNENNWSWFSDVKEITKLGFEDPEEVDTKKYGCNFVDVIGSGESDPLILRVSFPTSEKIMAFYGKQAYLVDDRFGSTIDILM